MSYDLAVVTDIPLPPPQVFAATASFSEVRPLCISYNRLPTLADLPCPHASSVTPEYCLPAANSLLLPCGALRQRSRKQTSPRSFPCNRLRLELSPIETHKEQTWSPMKDISSADSLELSAEGPCGQQSRPGLQPPCLSSAGIPFISLRSQGSLSCSGADTVCIPPTCLLKLAPASASSSE